MEISEKKLDGVSVVAVKGRIDSVNAPKLTAHLRALMSVGDARLVVDLDEVVYISSAGFRTLLITAKLATDHRGKLAICHLSAELRRLFEIAALLDFFKLYPNQAEAITALNELA